MFGSIRTVRTRRMAIPALGVAAALVIGACTAPQAAPALLTERVERADGIITNEYAYWNPRAADRRASPTWQVTSGSLFARGRAGWTGVPDDRTPNATSSTGTGSALFRMVSAHKGFKNVSVDVRLRHERYVATNRTPAVAWDGAHVFLRYQSEESLYYASVSRRDGAVAIKKKVPGGPSNGGTYYTLAEKRVPFPTNQWRDVRATIRDRSDGGVAIELAVGGKTVVTAVDKGVGGAPIRAGGIGLRGDNAQFSFDDLTVTPA